MLPLIRLDGGKTVAEGHCANLGCTRLKGVDLVL